MYIGEVSKLTKSTPKAIRLYEKLGLIPTPSRKGNYRYYKNSDVDLIKIIKEAQRVGFKLSEMKGLFTKDISCDEFPWEKAIALVNTKTKSINNEVKRLENLNVELKNLVIILREKIT